MAVAWLPQSQEQGKSMGTSSLELSTGKAQVTLAFSKRKTTRDAAAAFTLTAITCVRIGRHADGAEVPAQSLQLFLAFSAFGLQLSDGGG